VDEALLLMAVVHCQLCGVELVQGQYGGARKRCIDHCHATGRIRGVICTRCNSAIGYAGDSPRLLRRIADYLEAEGASK
jgi:hypothetical protein